eukprot:TRINITY_DN8132_c0_g1_i3.p1 TRINITY_DN8132_c0_g1~~TRINITY_DN8132_c0_g1_i3.p1  ORF type:complete len:270 (+),score=90.47 TRINITY_DN8132_c0_g1_i3:70-879(+)
MAVIIARHGERTDYVDKVAFFKTEISKERPWDPLLTEEGRRQARLMGTRVRAELEERGYPPVSKVFASPFIRTVETAEEACRSLGLDEINVENGIVEALCESWFRSWAVPGADTTWGGPPHNRVGVPVADEHVDPRAFKGPSAWLLTAPELKQRVSQMVNEEYTPHCTFSDDITWSEPETMSHHTALRCADTVRSLSKRFHGETVLFLSHAGPSAEMYAQLTGDGDKASCKYTAVFLCEPQDPEHEKPYTGILKGCSKHLADDAAPKKQ